jgi:alcohol dehydrogenase
MLATLGAACSPEIDPWFGTGLCTAAYKKTGLKSLPFIAIETNASSGAHLTKYSNITDIASGQKKLIVDEAIVPTVPFFDYAVTKTMPPSVTIDGALDAIAHNFEVFCGAKDDAAYTKEQELAVTAIDLVLHYAAAAVKNGSDQEAREALGLATDLGGVAIMVGGTSGPHLTSFSLIDIVAHGTACGLMNPYYAVFYSKKIQRQLKVVCPIFKKYGFISEDIDKLEGRELALSFARGMIAFEKSIGAPSCLNDIKGFGEAHIQRCLKAAKDPDLKMKLQNMPVPLTADKVDEYMEPILRSAASGDLSLIKEM